MGAKYYLSHPVTAIRKITYYVVGNILGRLFYPSMIFKSRWFDGLTEKGWEWVTRGLINQKIRAINVAAPWPVSPYQNVGTPDNIFFILIT